MKNLIFIILFFSFYSCIKETTTVPTEPYPYDSIHKSIIGDWVERGPNRTNTGLDTYKIVKIRYDSIRVESVPSINNNYDSSKNTEYKNILYFSVDSLKASQYINGTKFYDRRLRIRRYSKDSISFDAFFINPNGAGWPPYWSLTVVK